MPLQAQRFAGDPTLEACLAGSGQMTFGNPNADSVVKVQTGLSDLGYRPMPIDGQFGDITGAAVKRFKVDEGLTPSDAVIGVGTMGSLDGFYALESSTPDSPDPSAQGLEQIVEDVTINHVLPWFDAAAAVLDQFPDDQTFPADPAWVAFDAAMERNFHASLLPHGREHAVRVLFSPTYSAARRALADPFVIVEGRDRAGWDGDHHGPYRPASGVAGAHFIVTPPFRNVLSTFEQGLLIAKGGLLIAFSELDVLGFPGTARYANNGTSAFFNVIAYAAFGFEMATGIQATFQPRPVWP